MKTVVNSVLVLPDNPYLTQPVAVRIRTDDGNLMRRRLRRLLKDDRVVFIDARLIDELVRDLDELVDETYLPWLLELMHLECGADLALVDSMRAELHDRSEAPSGSNSVKYAMLCFACRELFQRARAKAWKMEIVELYISYRMKYENLKCKYDMLEKICNAQRKDYQELSDEHRNMLKTIVSNETLD